MEFVCVCVGGGGGGQYILKHLTGTKARAVVVMQVRVPDL